MPLKDLGQQREYLRAYRAAHRDAKSAYDRAYRAAHCDQIAARRRTYHAAHRTDRAAYKRAYRATHRSERAAYNRAYRAAHPDYNAAWFRDHPERRRELARQGGARRRARKVGAPSTLTVAQWIAIKAAYGSRCAYCGTKVARAQQEHVIPLACGGTHTADNVVPACGPCNSRKGVKPPVSIPAIRLMF